MNGSASSMLDDRERRALLNIAEHAIARALATGDVALLDERAVDVAALLRPGAAFVTLLRGDDLSDASAACTQPNRSRSRCTEPRSKRRSPIPGCRPSRSTTLPS